MQNKMEENRSLSELESRSEWLQLRLGPPHSKRPRISNGEASIDYISLLPDPIFQHILSFLTAKDVIKTSVFSKRWRSVWSAVPVRRFFCSSDEIITHFERFVTKTQRIIQEVKIQKLRFSFIYESIFSFQVDEWIRFSTESKVENLRLSMFSRNPNSSQAYQLPQSIYSNSSLKLLDTTGCDFNPSFTVSWTSLRALTISHGNLSNNAIARILLGSPNLEHLKLKMFAGVDSVDKIIVTSANMKLKELVLQTWGVCVSNMEISAPHI